MNLSVNWATAMACSQIFWSCSHRNGRIPGNHLSRFDNVILLHTPATMKEPSVAPGFGMTFPWLAKSLVAFSNIALRLAIGTVVIRLFTALMAADGADVGVLLH